MFHDNPLHPNMKLRYVEILNEPSLWVYFGDSEDWEDPTRPNKSMTGERMVPKYIELFNVAAGAIKQKYPDLLICGPVLHQGFTWRNNWGWETWLKPFLAQAGHNVDIIDYHRTVTSGTLPGSASKNRPTSPRQRSRSFPN
ncbi:MAG: hypothetical protein HC888_04500 [Candidatus Competibacteraceae bacterium]|nr:hypothetical protein [Candidatus Competibacteraceae bacterium]